MGLSKLSKAKDGLSGNFLLEKIMRLKVLFTLLLLLLLQTNGFGQTVTIQNTWSRVFNGTATTAQTVNYGAIPGGSNRLLVVAVSTSRTSNGSRSVSLTYGGQSLSSVTDDLGTSSWQHTALYYLNEAGIVAATNTDLVFTISGGTTRISNVFVATYTGVDQTTPVDSSLNYNSVGSNGASSWGASNLVVSSGGVGIKVLCVANNGSVTPTLTSYNPNSQGWAGILTPEPFSSGSTPAVIQGIAIKTTAGSTNGENTVSTSRNSLSGMSLKAAAATCTTTEGAIGSAQSICSGATPATLTSTTAGTGAGTITYEWQTNASGSYVTIGGATGATYAPPALTATTSYQRRTVDTNGSVVCYSAYTTPVTITVQGAGTASSNQLICSGTSPTDITLTGHSGTIQWQSSPDNSTWTNISGATATPLTSAQMGSLAATTYYRAAVTTGSCGVINSNVVTVTVTTDIKTQVGTNIMFTINTVAATSPASYVNTVTASGEYIVVNVVKGFQYSFVATNAFTGNETLSVMTTSNVLIGTVATGASGVTKTWTATISGQVRVVLTGTSCSITGSGTITATQTAIGNTQDSQTTTANDTWVGHVYNLVSESNTPPDATTIFVTSNYAGYITSPEAIDLELAALANTPNENTIPLFSNGVNRVNILGNSLGIRYRMHTTKTGCYLINIDTDDGARLYLNGTKVYEEWQSQALQTFGSILVSLDGDDDLVLEYYNQGSGGKGAVKYSIVPFDVSTNTVTSAAVACGAAKVLNGSTYLYQSPSTLSPYLQYQWQVSDVNSTNDLDWTNIGGATAEDYTIPAGPVTTTKFYRRVVSGTGIGNSVGGSPLTGIPNTTCSLPSTPIAVTGTPVIATQPTNPTAVCAGSGTQTMTVVATETVGITYQWYKGATPLTNTAPYSGTGTATLTLTNPTVTHAGTDYKVRVTGTCGFVESGLLTVAINAAVATPTVGTITQATCATPTGSVALSGLPFPGTLSQTGTVSASIATTGVSMTISGLAAGTYQFSVSNGTCASSTTANVVISTLASKTWTAGAWSPAGAPTSTDVVVIDDTYTTATNGNLNACSLTVNSGRTMTISLGGYAIIQNHLTVNGTLNVLNTGNLVMVNDAGVVSGAGTTHVAKICPSVQKYDYVFWSTPLSSGGAPFTGWTNSYNYNYSNFLDGNADGLDDDGNVWVPGGLSPGVGCIIRSPVGASGSTITFSGTVNNGVINVLGGAGSFLVGNPYPSAISADEFILANAGVFSDALGFWTHNTAITLASNLNAGTAGSGAYAYTSDDYAMYNLSGGTSAAISGGATPLGFIASGQGFFMKASGDVVFNNAMRLNGTSAVYDNSQFFKTKASKTKKTAAIEKNRVWLDLVNDKGAFKQTLVGYIGGATDGIDALYDGRTLDANDYIDFYSINQEENLVIQGRALPFDTSDEVPLGYKTKITGEFKIKIAKVDGLLAKQAVYLEDKLLDTVVDLKEGDYVFTTEKGTFKERFVLRYASKTKTTDLETTKTLVVSLKDGQIRVDSPVTKMEKVHIFDVTGKLLYKSENIGDNTFEVINFNFAHEVLIVKVTLENGEVITEKIIY